MAVKAFLIATQFALEPGYNMPIDDPTVRPQIVIPNWQYRSMKECKAAMESDVDAVGEFVPVVPGARMIVRQYVCYSEDFSEVYTRIIHVRSET